jgi:hypothetical protein
MSVNILRLRLATLTDARKLADLHWYSSSKQPDSFMYRLGKGFLLHYYRILLKAKNSVILCAEDGDGTVIGFVSGFLDGEERMLMLRRNRLRLAIASIPALLRSPSLLLEIFSRFKSKSADSEEGGYIVYSTSPHEDYWAWSSNRAGAIELHLKWLGLMRLLGAKQIIGEVDKENHFVVKTHQMLGAQVVKDFITPDGKNRLLIKYILDKK